MSPWKLVSALLLAGAAVAGDPPAVGVPVFPNATCPIMGKRASTKLFVDTPKGRIYMCCVRCAGEIRKDPDRAHATAYPKVEKTANTACPVTGKALPEKDAPTVVLQGYEIPLCCKECVEEARKESQVTLVKATNAKVRDIGNRTCPVTGKAVEPNAFALVGDDLVRLSSPDCVEAVRKDPAAVVKKAKEIAAGAPSGKGRGEGEGRGGPGDEGGHGR